MDEWVSWDVMMGWMGREVRADQAFSRAARWGEGALHGVRPKRLRSSLETRARRALVDGSVSGINGRSVHVDAWMAYLLV